MKYTTTDNITRLLDCLEKGEKLPVIDGIYSQNNGFVTTEKCGRNEYIHPNRNSTAKYRKN